MIPIDKSILQLAKIEIDSGDYTEARIRLMRFNQMYGVKKPLCNS